MRGQKNTQTHSRATVIPRAYWLVAEVAALENFSFRVSFQDGLTGIVEMYDYIHSPNAGVFAALSDEAEFRRIGLESGAVTWANGLDLAPDNMHIQITAGDGIYHMSC